MSGIPQRSTPDTAGPEGAAAPLPHSIRLSHRFHTEHKATGHDGLTVRTERYRRTVGRYGERRHVGLPASLQRPQCRLGTPRRLVSAGWCVGALGLIVSKYGIDAVIGVDVSDRHRATENTEDLTGHAGLVGGRAVERLELG